MAVSRTRATARAEELIAIPRAHVPVTLRQTKTSVTLLHKGQALTKCYINRSGIKAATYMAHALGVRIPPLGSHVKTTVSTGVLWRAISISCLDFRKPESYILLQRLLEDAEIQRSSRGTEA
jgi:hypothetical protein